MRLGVMGGTFDPIHLGHLRAAETVREALDLHAIVFVPAHVPPHRKGPLSSALDRYAMVCLATSGREGFVPSDLELRREGPSFTVDTLEALTESHPGDEIVLIVGSDTYPEMGGWRDPEGIFSRCRIAVVTRAGEAQKAGPERPGVERVAGLALPISGTAIRERVAEGRSIRYLVPEGVADYIAKRGLYR